MSDITYPSKPSIDDKKTQQTPPPEYVPLKDFAEDSDLHGIKQLTRAENGVIKRVIWGTLLLVAVGFLVSNTVQQVISFFQWEHVTKYDIEFVSELDFPSVTICNMNRNRRSALTKEDIGIMGPHLGFTYENNTLIHEEGYPSSWVDSLWTGTDWDAIKAGINEEDYDMVEFFNRTGHQYHDLVQHCQWKSDLCDQTAWATDFTHYGKCYTFNEGGSFQLLKAGAGNGLHLVLNVEHDEYLETDDAEDLGLKFLPHAHYEPPFLKELGYGLAPGFHYLIALQERRISGIPAPYTECVQNKDMKYFDTYSVPACRIECETEMIFDTCGCKLVESPGDHPICNPTQYDCAEEKLLAIEQSDDCLCENPCDANQYTFKMSMLELRETTIEKLRKDHPIPAHLTTADLIVLNVYFDLLAFENIEQVAAYTWLDILSDFGGTMGLWLGASILAAFQLVEYCCIKCCSVCKKNEKTTVSPVNKTDA